MHSSLYIYPKEKRRAYFMPNFWVRWQAWLRRYFVDLRVMTVLMCGWLCVVLGVLVELGVSSGSKFVAFGPRADLTFMHVAIDTHYKYYILVAMIVVHTFVTDLIADSLVPHVLNFVQVRSRSTAICHWCI